MRATKGHASKSQVWQGVSHSRATRFRNRVLLYSMWLWRASESDVKDARQNRRCDIGLTVTNLEHGRVFKQMLLIAHDTEFIQSLQPLCSVQERLQKHHANWNKIPSLNFAAKWLRSNVWTGIFRLSSLSGVNLKLFTSNHGNVSLQITLRCITSLSSSLIQTFVAEHVRYNHFSMYACK